MNHNWYAVITAQVLMSKDISPTQKLLIALISNLSSERGYCFASNQYLSECLDVAPETISRNISDLVDKNYIGRILKIDGNKRVEIRILTVVERQPLPDKMSIPPHENVNTPPLENVKENNKVFNNKDNSYSTGENETTCNAEETMQKSPIEYERLLMNKKIDFTRGGEILHKYHLHLVEKDLYPMKRRSIFAGFEKWLMTEKVEKNGTYQQSNRQSVKTGKSTGANNLLEIVRQDHARSG